MGISQIRVANLRSLPELGRVYLELHGASDEGICTCSRGPDCRSPGKHPVSTGWTSGRLGDLEAARAWILRGRNVGIATGQRTGILVVDLDGPEAIEWWRGMGASLDTLEVETGNGRHIYLKHPSAEIRNSVRALGPGVDIRAEGGQVVAPGSRHSSGRLYKADCSVDELAPCPPWLVALLTQEQRPTERTQVSLEGGKIQTGSRNQSMLSLLGLMRSRGFDDESILETARLWNGLIFEDPLPLDEAESVAASVCRYPAGSPVRLIRIGNQTRALETETSGAITPYAVAQAYLSASSEDPLVYHRQSWFRFNGRIYEEVSSESVELELFELVGANEAIRRHATRRFISDTFKNVAASVRMSDALELPTWTVGGRPRQSIACLNGVLDLESYLEEQPFERCLHPHSPDFVSTTCLPFEVDEDAWCPVWEATLDTILPRERHGTTRNELQKWFGLHLTTDMRHQRAAVLVGDGGNGKSTVLEVLAAMLGDGSFSTVPLEKFEDRFSLAEMLGKRANIAHEMGDLDKASEGVLKQLVSGEPMTFERKFRDPFKARPTARLSFATNVLPRFSDKTDGLWRRLLIFPFTESIPVERRDRDLVSKLRAELPGIFNWSVQGLAMLASEGFRDTETMLHSKQAHREGLNPVLSWLEECTTVGSAFETSSSRALESYRSWCAENGFQSMNRTNWERELERLGLKCVRSRDGQSRPRVIKGLHLDARSH